MTSTTPSATASPAATAAVAALLFLPVFLHVGPGGGIGPGESNLYVLKTPGADLPLSFFLGPALALLTLTALGPPRRFGLGAHLACWYAAAQLVSVGVGSLLGMTDLTSLVFCYQALVPLPWVVVGSRLAELEPADRDRFLAVALAVPVLVGAVFVAATLAGGPTDPRIGVVDTLGPLVNSKALRYFPTVLVIAAWYHAERRRPGAGAGAGFGVAALAVAAAYSVLGHSRSSYLLFAAFAATAFAARARRDLVATSAMLVALAFGAVGAVAYVATAEQLPRSLERWTGADDSANVSSERHWSALTGGIVDGASSPLGRMYAADVTENLAGVERGTGQVANAESQFSEAALRSGPLGLLPLLAITAFGTVAALRGLFRGLQRSDAAQAPSLWSERWAHTTFLVLWPLSGLVQLNLTEAYVAPLTWLSAGLALGLAPAAARVDASTPDPTDRACAVWTDEPVGAPA